MRFFEVKKTGRFRFRLGNNGRAIDPFLSDHNENSKLAGWGKENPIGARSCQRGVRGFNRVGFLLLWRPSADRTEHYWLFGERLT